MSVIPFPQPTDDMTPAAAIAKVAPERQSFAIALGDAEPRNISQFCREYDISRPTYYAWRDDPAVVAYITAYRRSIVGRARDALLKLALDAVDTLGEALSNPKLPMGAIRAAETILDRVGLSKEAALPKHAPVAADPVLNINLSMPTNPNEVAEQQERRRRREARALEARYRTQASERHTPDLAD